MAIRDKHFTAMVDEALARETARNAGDWAGAIRLARGAEGLRLLRDHGRELPDDEHWQALGEKHREAGELHLGQFAGLYLSDRLGREHVMTAKDRKALGGMDDTFTVWRGGRCPLDDLRQGFSWTIDRETALCFAKKYRASILTGPPRLLRATCLRSEVVGYFTDRGESEILVSPATLRNIVEEAI